MALEDIRLKFDFLRHAKTKALRSNGDAYVLALLSIWLWAGENARKGILLGMNDEDIAEVAMWDGSPSVLTHVLSEAGFMHFDEQLKAYVLTNWHKNQPYIFNYEQVAEKNRQNAKRGWNHRKISNASRTDSNRFTIPNDATGIHETSNESVESAEESCHSQCESHATRITSGTDAHRLTRKNDAPVEPVDPVEPNDSGNAVVKKKEKAVGSSGERIFSNGIPNVRAGQVEEFKPDFTPTAFSGDIFAAVVYYRNALKYNNVQQIEALKQDTVLYQQVLEQIQRDREAGGSDLDF